MEKAEGPALSIVVPVHDSAGHLPRVIPALLSGMSGDDELIVVDDRSTDGSPDVCRALGVEAIESDRPPGAAGTRNCGAFAGRREWILFVDSDAVPPPGWRDSLLRDSGDVQALQAVYSREAPGRSAATFYKNYYYHYTFTRRIRERHIPGCGTFFFAVRRDAFTSLGGFDEKIAGATVEDADFAARLNASGGRILLLPGLEILHLREYTLRGLLGYDWAMAKAKARYMTRRGPGHGKLSLSMAGVSEMLPVAVSAAAVWPALAGILGFAAGWRAGLPLAAVSLGAVLACQSLFWAACVRAGGSRGLRACLVGLADLLVMGPAALAGFAGPVFGRRY
jgi:glycosyltransferase involved in cell wall biosynthesis